MESNPLSAFLSLVAQSLLIIALPIVIAGAFLYVRRMIAEIKQKLSKEQLDLIETGVNLAVRAAEQSGLAGKLTGGTEKKSYAVDAVQSYPDRLGIAIDVKEISMLIEAEVNKQFANPTPPVDSPEARSALIDKAVDAAVLAAEQTGVKGLIVDTGVDLAQAKKQYALNLAEKYLKDHGVEIDMSVVDGLIEAQIMRLKLQALEWRSQAN